LGDLRGFLDDLLLCRACGDGYYHHHHSDGHMGHDAPFPEDGLWLESQFLRRLACHHHHHHQQQQQQQQHVAPLGEGEEAASSSAGAAGRPPYVGSVSSHFRMRHLTVGLTSRLCAEYVFRPVCLATRVSIYSVYSWQPVPCCLEV
jgi:hypothetical protein